MNLGCLMQKEKFRYCPFLAICMYFKKALVVNWSDSINCWMICMHPLSSVNHHQLVLMSCLMSCLVARLIITGPNASARPNMRAWIVRLVTSAVFILVVDLGGGGGGGGIRPVHSVPQFPSKLYISIP
jgi:hypothetical protein